MNRDVARDPCTNCSQSHCRCTARRTSESHHGSRVATLACVSGSQPRESSICLQLRPLRERLRTCIMRCLKSVQPAPPPNRPATSTSRRTAVSFYTFLVHTIRARSEAKLRNKSQKNKTNKQKLVCPFPLTRTSATITQSAFSRKTQFPF